MDCLFCKEKARCRIEMKFNYATDTPFGINKSYRIIEYFCGRCQTFLRVVSSNDDTIGVLEKVPKLFDCAINFDKGLLS